MEDVLSIDPKELLTPVTVSDATKRQLIDCLDASDTAVKCPNLPVPDVWKKLKDLVVRVKQQSENKGLLGGLLSGLGALIGGGSDGVTSILTEASKAADSLMKIFEQVKSLYAKDNNGGLPEDPYQDISDYLKEKHASDTKYDLIAATKTRGKLRDIFANTNDDILHKYSSNYNSLIPHVQLVGVVRMILEAYS